MNLVDAIKSGSVHVADFVVGAVMFLTLPVWMPLGLVALMLGLGAQKVTYEGRQLRKALARRLGLGEE